MSPTTSPGPCSRAEDSSPVYTLDCEEPDNALAETVNGLYKTELIYARPAWPSATEVEFETMNWVHWWNTTRLHEALNYQTPTEAEASYHMTQAHVLSPV
ncbi:hypothetical protein DCC26_10020 [Auritidibacter sp. NML120779]|nr:hypothetical protein DCC26_10020 [Auritidibacter sp. NML120779]